MLIFNPTKEVVRCQHGGMWTNFKPGEKKDIYDNYAAKHILNRWASYGLVELTFGEKETKQFDDFEEFEQSQKVKGLKQNLKRLEKGITDSMRYDKACGEKDTEVRQEVKEQRVELEKSVAGLKRELAEVEKISMKKTPQQKADILLKKAKAMELEARTLLKNNGNDAAKSD